MIDVMYLRKSREDAEMEKLGKGETLSQHYKILTELAKKHNIVISEENVLREVVSGESIDARPEMQKLLKMVENGLVRSVLVVEIERLARGDTSDQGRVAKTFKYSNTKIITPMKIYDPNNEFDNEYFEFGLFMSRREYLTINRRLNRGKYEGARDGRFIGSTPPYGYERIKIANGKGYTLVPGENAKYVKMIYEWALEGNGSIHIAKMLTDIGAPTTTGTVWSSASVRNILQNKTYCGYVSWQRRKTEKTLVDGVTTKTRKRNDKQADYFKGLHEAIISEEDWERARYLRESRALPSCNDNKGSLSNPLAGIVKCGYCGRTIQGQRHQNNRIRMRCPNLQCECGSTYLEFVENDLIKALQEWLEGYLITTGKQKPVDNKIDILKDSLTTQNSELEKIKSQINKTCELLEQGIYDNEMFLERNSALKKQKSDLEERIAALTQQIENAESAITNRKEIVPKLQGILDNYFSWDTRTKNKVLKEVLEKVIYTRKKGTPLNPTTDDFDLEIFPKLPLK